jgi:hypothetical protein
LEDVTGDRQLRSAKRGGRDERVGDGTLGRGGQDRADTESTGNERGLHVEERDEEELVVYRGTRG